MMFRKALIGASAALAICACTAQNSLTPQQQSEYSAKQLLLLMDRDQNGKVSRAEFMSFMSAEFDRLDVNHDGQLDVNELTALHYGTSHPGGTVGTR